MADLSSGGRWEILFALCHFAAMEASEGLSAEVMAIGFDEWSGGRHVVVREKILDFAPAVAALELHERIAGDA